MKALAITFGALMMVILSPFILCGFVVRVCAQGVVFGWNIGASMFEVIEDKL